MAGLWETWTGGDGEKLESCIVIVTDANALVRELHDRMPVILAQEDHAAWLDPSNRNKTGLLKMLHPADPEGWELRPVSRKVNSPRNDSADLLEPVAAPRT